ncbi:hypothetical protein K466DRAFT_593331 [Polyporus arcularius HHB13444]|uniref:Transmembrane protein n=1 Tax=Polyporus arcularius HHB13444 TaxID=1314778 RepID=A0A5C3PXV4_9APHY|nr:hypothetical protein K466DRAFT_593331 [Polyporus arcularius HHB13444]
MAKHRKSRRTNEARGLKENVASASPMPEVRKRTHDIDTLFFPTDASSPHIVRVPCVVQDDEEYDGEESHTINWQPLLGDNAAFTSQPVGAIETRTGTSSTPYTASRLYLAFNDCFAIDGSPINRCAEQLTSGRSPTEWRGNMVGYRAREPADELTQFLDVSMSDLADFVRFLNDHGSHRALDPEIRSAERAQQPTDPDETGHLASILATQTLQTDEDADIIEELGSMRMPGPPPGYYATGRHDWDAAPFGAQAEPRRRSRSDASTLTREASMRRMIREELREELFTIAILLGGGYMTLHFLFFPAIAALYRVWGVKTFLSFLWFVCRGLFYGMIGLPVVLIGIPLMILAVFVFTAIAFCCVAAGLSIS